MGPGCAPSHVQQLFTDGPSDGPRWSPDGTEIRIFCCDDGMVAQFINPDSGNLRTLPPPDPTLETFCGGAWSLDGKRLACEVFGVNDPSRNGIHSIRSSDGGGLTRITSNPPPAKSRCVEAFPPGGTKRFPALSAGNR